MASFLKIENVDKIFTRGSATTKVLENVSLRVEKGTICLHHRPFGLRQIHAAQHCRRPSVGDERRRHSRGAGSQRTRSRPRNGLSEPLAASLAFVL